jgi:hypothetical protein
VPRASRPALLASAAILAGATASLLARADDRVSLRWSAPQGCPSEAAVAAEVTRLLGPSSVRPPRPVEATVTVTRVGEGFAAHLETTSSAGVRARDLHGATCAGVGDAVALILALAIDPAHVVAPERGGLAAAAGASASASAPPVAPTPPPAAPTASPSAPPITPPAAPIAPPTPPSAPRLQLALALGPVLDVGSVPIPAGGVAGALGASLGRARLDAGLTALPARAGHVTAGAAAGGDVSLVAGSLAASYALVDAAPLALGPSLGLELGRLHAAGFGVAAPGDGSILWATPSLGARGSLALGSHLAVTLALAAGFPLARPNFVLENVGAVFRPAPVVGRAALALEARF